MPDWYRKEVVREIAAQYLWKLRSIIREHPHLRPCLKRCRHCGIFFLTHPRNARRDDIDCPFGCRKAHRKQCSQKRSAAYYQTPEGKLKKKLLNGNRKDRDNTNAASEVDQSLLVHLQLVTSLIEGRQVVRADIESMVKRILRQLSFDKEGKCVYQTPYSENLPP